MRKDIKNVKFIILVIICACIGIYIQLNVTETYKSIGIIIYLLSIYFHTLVTTKDKYRFFPLIFLVPVGVLLFFSPNSIDTPVSLIGGAIIISSYLIYNRRKK